MRTHNVHVQVEPQLYRPQPTYNYPEHGNDCSIIVKVLLNKVSYTNTHIQVSEIQTIGPHLVSHPEWNANSPTHAWLY